MSRYLLTNDVGFDSLGADLPEGFSYYPQTFTYNVNGTLNTITTSGAGGTYIQTFTWISGNLGSISAWVKQ